MIEFTNFKSPVSQEEKEQIISIIDDSELQIIMDYLRDEFLVEFEKEFGKKDNSIAVKFVGQIPGDGMIFNLSAVIENGEIIEKEMVYNNYKELTWDNGSLKDENGNLI
jgi:hypothetical protein